MMADERMHNDDGRGWSRRRLAKVAIVAAGLAAFGGAGLSGALAQQEGDDVIGSGGSGVFADDFASGIIADIFASGGLDFDDDVASGGSGDMNVGGNSGGSITVGGSGGGISIGGGSGGSGSGSNSGSGGDDDD